MDSVYLQFKDILGRKTFYLELQPNNFSGWNIIQNRRYDKKYLSKQFPFITSMEIIDLIYILWGVTPEFNQAISSNDFEDSHFNSQISFLFEDTEMGLLINEAKYIMTENENNIQLKIKKRVFGQPPVSIKRNIPVSIPWD